MAPQRPSRRWHAQRNARACAETWDGVHGVVGRGRSESHECESSSRGVIAKHKQPCRREYFLVPWHRDIRPLSRGAIGCPGRVPVALLLCNWQCSPRSRFAAMLPRAAFRALHARPALAAPRIASIAATWPWTRTSTRAYAKSPRPPRLEQDHTWKQSDPIKFDETRKARPHPAHPSEQPGCDSASSPERNTTPTEPTSPTPDDAPPSHAPQKPLPDLRYGIPSALAAEHADAESKEEPAAGSTSGREGGELPKSAYETSTDRRRNRVANWSYLAMLLFGTTGAVYMGRNWESEEEELAHADAPNGWAIGQMYARAAARVNGQKAYYTEPTFQKLLPDKDKIPGGAPELTLVLSLEDLLLHSEWSTKNGYRLAKRPGLDYFLRYLSSQYELVIFTSVKSMDADPIIRKLDPFRLVMWPLFREATRFEKGEYIKVRLRAPVCDTVYADHAGSLLPQSRPLQSHHV